MPWRFYPDHPAYTPDIVEELESQLQEKGVAKGSPYFADVAYNRLCDEYATARDLADPFRLYNLLCET
jgi:hypothetical protein